MCSFITQHKATDVASFEERAIGNADCRNVHQSVLPVNLCSFLYHKPSPKTFQRIWQYIQPASQHWPLITHTSPEPPHPASSPPRSSETRHPDIRCKQSVWKKDSLWVSPIVWVSGLLMSTLWIEWPMVTVGLWYGQAYVMDNEHRCILLMAFWMHSDTVTRYWGPLLCHSSTTITSCCSMKMHGPMFARICTQFLEAENIPVLAMASILTGHVTHWACLGCSGSAYMTACSSSCQYPATSHSHWRGVDQHSIGHYQQTWLTLCEGDVLHWQMVVTQDTDWISDPPIQ